VSWGCGGRGPSVKNYIFNNVKLSHLRGDWHGSCLVLISLTKSIRMPDMKINQKSENRGLTWSIIPCIVGTWRKQIVSHS
jgi:hypothetical protein